MAAKIDNDDLVICPICFEQFTNPKCLPCLHTFCLPCLNSYIITQLGGEDKTAKNFPCPVCRQEVSVTDMNLTSDKIAESLPGNRLMNSLIEKKSSDNCPNEKICGPCDFDNEKIVAVSWCTQCLESLCGDCANSHKRFRHVMVPLGTPEEKPAELLDVDEPCIKHPGKVLEVYCIDHKEMCCVICLTKSHRKCDHVSTFEEMVTGSNSESVEQFIDFLTEIEKKTDGLKIKAEENLTTLSDSHDQISKKVTTAVQQAKDKLDHLQSDFITKFQQIQKQESVKLTEAKQRIEIFHQNVRKGQQLLKTVREKASPKQLFITKEKLKVQLKNHMAGLKDYLKDSDYIEYVLNIDGVVASILNTLTSVAEIEVKPTLGLSTGLIEVSDVMGCLYKEQRIDIMELEVNKECNIKVNSQITGGTFLPDGRLVFCCFNTEKLQVYDRACNFLFGTTCKNGKPRDACLISTSDIIVSLYGQPYLYKYRIQQNTIKEMDRIPCKSEAWGLAATIDSIIVGYRGEVDVMSMDGQIVQNFSRTADDVVLFVTLSLSKNLYYIDGNDIVCKTLEGVEISRFSHQSLKRLTGIAVDKYDNVFVCGYNSNNICIFSPDGQRSKVLVTGVQRPIKIMLDPTETNICVTTFEKGVFLYSLKN